MKYFEENCQELPFFVMGALSFGNNNGRQTPYHFFNRLKEQTMEIKETTARDVIRGLGFAQKAENGSIKEVQKKINSMLGIVDEDTDIPDEIVDDVEMIMESLNEEEAVKVVKDDVEDDDDDADVVPLKKAKPKAKRSRKKKPAAEEPEEEPEEEPAPKKRGRPKKAAAKKAPAKKVARKAPAKKTTAKKKAPTKKAGSKKGIGASREREIPHHAGRVIKRHKYGNGVTDEMVAELMKLSGSANEKQCRRYLVSGIQTIQGYVSRYDD